MEIACQHYVAFFMGWRMAAVLEVALSEEDRWEAVPSVAGLWAAV
jgi:hypothetical protein